MEFKRCARCGAFYVTEGEVCQNCMPKDKLDMQTFQNYIADNAGETANNISLNTGINLRNVNRYLGNL